MAHIASHTTTASSTSHSIGAIDPDLPRGKTFQYTFPAKHVDSATITPGGEQFTPDHVTPSPPARLNGIQQGDHDRLTRSNPTLSARTKQASLDHGSQASTPDHASLDDTIASTTTTTSSRSSDYLPVARPRSRVANGRHLQTTNSKVNRSNPPHHHFKDSSYEDTTAAVGGAGGGVDIRHAHNKRRAAPPKTRINMNSRGTTATPTSAAGSTTTTTPHHVDSGQRAKVATGENDDSLAKVVPRSRRHTATQPEIAHRHDDRMVNVGRGGGGDGDYQNEADESGASLARGMYSAEFEGRSYIEAPSYADLELDRAIAAKRAGQGRPAHLRATGNATELQGNSGRGCEDVEEERGGGSGAAGKWDSGEGIREGGRVTSNRVYGLHPPDDAPTRDDEVSYGPYEELNFEPRHPPLNNNNNNSNNKDGDDDNEAKFVVDHRRGGGEIGKRIGKKARKDRRFSGDDVIRGRAMVKRNTSTLQSHKVTRH